MVLATYLSRDESRLAAYGLRRPFFLGTWVNRSKNKGKGVTRPALSIELRQAPASLPDEGALSPHKATEGV